MFKKILLITLVVAVIGVLIFGAVNRTLAKNDREGSTQDGYGRAIAESGLPAQHTDETIAQSQRRGRNENPGNGAGEDHSTGGYVDLTGEKTGELTPAEIDALLYMREEEKLAGDVYAAMYDLWGLSIFNNISQSEQMHTSAVKQLMDRYSVADPASSQAGVFTNPELQALYTDLVSRGSNSLEEALKVGGAIEEIDILDLEERLGQTENAEVEKVLINLKDGSYRHLQAYASNYYRQTGQVYQPTYLSVEAYQAIVGDVTANTGKGQGAGQTAGQGTGQAAGQGGGYRGGRP